MFYDFCPLKNIEELKYLNASNANNFSCIFYGWTPLSDIKYLQNWNVSYTNNFSAK